MDDKEKELLGELGQALGLDKGFVGKVQARGQVAVANRVIATDEIGALTRLVALLQYLGIYIEDRLIAGEPMESEEMLEAIADFSEEVDIEPGMAVHLVGPVLDIFEQATGLLIEGPTDAE